ncbi:MAG: glutathione S-transferase family protein [Defluviicoccus sp.]|nr:glutathione S-transferase family protein [Defluviicoccus sp.]
MLELYDFNNSVCAQKVRMTLAEKGLDWTERAVDLFRLEQYDPKYLAVNPKGVVPTLVHDGTPVIESTLICEYLDDVFPDPPLRPAAPAELSAMRVWAKTVDEGLHAGITAISFSAMFRERMRGMTDEQRARRWRNIGDPARSDRDRSVYEQGVESPYVYNAIAAYESAFEKLEKTLSHAGPWVMGDAFTIADIVLAPYMARLDYLTLLEVWTGDRPGVAGWWARFGERDSCREQLSGRLTPEMIEPMNRFGAAIRERMAERREEHLAELAAVRADAA